MRQATISRKTKETDIDLRLSLDGGPSEISTGIGFFDHMLHTFSVHSGFGMELKVIGDLLVDCHHTVEDTGIVLGKAFQEAIGDRSSIARYGSFYVPMDEALAFASVDVSGRPYLVFDGQFPEERVGDFDTCMTSEFFHALAYSAGLTLHIRVLYGNNSHHMIEAAFKAAAHAMRIAVAPTRDQVLSTKGVLS